MKKLLAVFLSVLICFTFSGCSMLFDYQSEAINNFDIGYSKILNEAFVSSYNWDGTEDTMNIVIPEEYRGIPITSLGGYFGRGVPCAFGVDLTESYQKSLCDEANQWGTSKIYDDIENIELI